MYQALACIAHHHPDGIAIISNDIRLTYRELLQRVDRLSEHLAMVIGGDWRKKEVNRSAFADGFWKSGDMAMMDDDGYVYIAPTHDEELLS